MMHDDLLDIATRLAQLEQGRPRRTSLRRAISSAYYALFHALATLCANQLVGYLKDWDFYVPIYRTLDHARAKEVFKRISGKHGAQIAFIGQTFTLLQERRHTADCDPSPFPFGRTETLDLIEQARQAIRRIDDLALDDRLYVATPLIARTRPGRMKFTLSWLKDHLETTASLGEIVETLTHIGLEVEHVDDPAREAQGFRHRHESIEAKPHPNADRLRVCRVDAGPARRCRSSAARPMRGPA